MNAASLPKWNSMGEIDEDSRKEINDLIAAVERKAGVRERMTTASMLGRYKVLKEAFGAGICVFKDGVIEETNTAFDSMLGFTINGPKGFDVSSFIEPADMDKLLAKMEKGAEDPCEIKFIRRDGSYFYAWAMLRNIEFNSEKVTALTVFNITQYVEEKRVLKEETAFLEDVFNKLPDAFFVADLQGRLMRWNVAFEQISGYSEGELADMSIIDFIEEEDMPIVEEEMVEAFENNIRETIEVTAIAKDGRRMPYEFSGGFLIDDEGKPIGVYGIGRDITYHKRALNILELQRDLALKILEADSLRQVFEFCLADVLFATGIDSGSIYKYERANGSFKMVNSVGLPQPLVFALKNMAGGSIEAAQMRAGKPNYRARDIIAISKNGSEANERLRCVALVPIFHNGVLQGCLCAMSHEPGEISEESRAVIEGLMPQIGKHIHWAQRQFA